MYLAGPLSLPQAHIWNTLGTLGARKTAAQMLWTPKLLWASLTNAASPGSILRVRNEMEKEKECQCEWQDECSHISLPLRGRAV